MRFRALTILFLLSSTLVAPSAPAAEPPPRFAQRWVYLQTNLLVDKNVDDALALIARAGKAGYNGVVLADYKFNILERMPPKYIKNVERVKTAANAVSIEVIPTVFPIGYSDGLLHHDANLAEGLPVKDAPFVVKDGLATLAADRTTGQLLNGDLEEVKGDRFTGFSFQDDPGKTTFVDHDVVHHGKASCRMEDPAKGSTSGNCRLSQRVKVRPFACYRYSCWVKTKDLKQADAFKLLVLGKEGRRLSFYEGQLKPTQDWTQIEVIFNSLDQTDVQLYAGQWGGSTGKLWLDELELKELALVNVLRRDGCPVSVISADGAPVFLEGKDYRTVQDAKLFADPQPGHFGFNHHGAELRLTPESRIKEGDRLRVGWYHPIVVHGEQVMCCLTEPKVYAQLRDQAKRVNDLLQPTTFFMSHDEIRVAGWCKSCQGSGKTPGELLAANARQCVEILKEVNPKAKVIVWSDMFDPNHNAVKNFYLVNGPLDGSWKGLPENVAIANWNGGKPAASLKWFADQGHTQVIAGYYDGNDLKSFQKWDAAAKDVKGVTGFMYTTWQKKYDLLEAYGRAMLGK
jgi:hypothetical protein